MFDLEREPGLAQRGIEAGCRRLALHVRLDTPDVGRGERRLPLGGRLLLEAGAERGDQRIVVRGAGFRRRKALVRRQLGKPDGAHQRLPFLLGAHGEAHPPFG